LAYSLYIAIIATRVKHKKQKK